MNDFLLTQCPHCSTSFKVSDEQLGAAEGIVRCGSCRHTFTAQPFPIKAQSAGTENQSKSELLTITALKDDEELERLSPDQFAALDSEVISISHPAPVNRMKELGLMFACVFLLLSLLFQFLLFNLESLSQRPGLQGLTSAFCSVFSCPEELNFEIRNFYTDELAVQSHPQYLEALQVDFIFRNASDREQLFPLAELNFYDINRRLLANRLFTPQEYLPEELTQLTHVPGNTSVQARLEIADPGVSSINYTLVLRAP